MPDQFSTPARCRAFLETVRWGGVPKCPYCESERCSAIRSESRHHCNLCHTSFSVLVNTVFHRTRLDLRSWFYAVYRVTDPFEEVSARQVARELHISKDTGCRIVQRIREALFDPEHQIIFARINEAFISEEKK